MRKSFISRRFVASATVVAIVAVVLSAGLLLGAQGSEARTSWALTSSIARADVQAPGEVARVGTKWASPSNSAGRYIFDTEIYDQNNQRVSQWYVWRSVGDRHTFDVSFNWHLLGVEDGIYTIKQGVFTPDWSRTLEWNNESLRVNIRAHRLFAVLSSSAEQPGPSPTPSTAPSTTAPAPRPTTSLPPVTTAPKPIAASASGNPLAGASFYGVNHGAIAQAQAWSSSRPSDAALMRRLGSIPTSTWVGDWSGDITSTVNRTITAANGQGKVPVFVVYNIPNRDCGNHSSGGARSESDYNSWIDGLGRGLNGKAVVIVEPDALAIPCGDMSARYRMIARAVDVLSAKPGVSVYVDAGHGRWVDAGTMASRLKAVNVSRAAGFALNVSNFVSTSENIAYGERLSSLLNGAHFVIDTSRNGNGTNGEWCNPWGRAVGQVATSSTGHSKVDAYLWVKPPGESDGTCNGGPAAGHFWPEYALGLARSAWG